MEGVSVAVYTGLRGYWRRKNYEKLNASSGGRKSTKVGLGSSQKGRRVWRIKITPKLRLLRGMASPKKIFLWLRDAYVKLMLEFANSRVGSAGCGGAGIASFSKRAPKEYDEKMIVEICKTLVPGRTRLGSVL